MNALIPARINHVTFATNEADIDHVLGGQSVVPRRNAVPQIAKVLAILSVEGVATAEIRQLLRDALDGFLRDLQQG